MAHTLISTYDNFPAAEHARNALLASGFPSSNLYLSSQQDEAGPVSGNFLMEEEEPAATRADESNHYLHQDSYLLTVDADDPADLNRASDIVSRCGALLVSQRTSLGKGDEA